MQEEYKQKESCYPFPPHCAAVCEFECLLHRKINVRDSALIISLALKMAQSDNIDNFIEKFDNCDNIDKKLRMFFVRNDVQDFITERAGWPLAIF